MRYHLTILFSILSLFSFAQFEASNLLPIKIEQKWGLIDENGNIVMEPKYDLIGTRFGSQRLVNSRLAPAYVTVQLGNKIGLVNIRGTEVLAPLFDEVIESFADSIFTVKNDGKLLVVNSQGETIFDGKYEEVIPISGLRGFYIIRENGKYGLLKKGEGYIIPNEYSLLQVHQLRKSYLEFKTKTSAKKEKYGIIDFENKIILPAEFDSIKMINQNVFLTKNDFFELRNADNEILVSEKDRWSAVKILSTSFLSFSSNLENQTKIYSLKSQAFIEVKTDFDEFVRFRSNFILGKKDGKFGLINTLGNEVIPPRYNQIMHMEGDTLFKVEKFLWGVYNIKQGLITTINYDAIELFQDKFAVVKTRGKSGLINRKGQEVASIDFEYFQFQDEFVKAFVGTKMHYFQADSLDQLALLEIYPEVYTLRIGYGETMDGMPNILSFNQSRVRRRRSKQGRGEKKKPDYSLINHSDVEWFVDWGRWGLRRKSTEEILIKPQYEFTRKLPFTDLTIVYSYDKKIAENDLLKLLSIRPKAGSFGIAFYSHQQEKFVTDFEFLGIRIDDFFYDLPFASLLDKNGNHTLIDQKGIVHQDHKTYNYIGDFYEGKARVCLGGISKKRKSGKEKGYKITSTTTFQNSYQIRFNRFNTLPTNDFFIIGGTWGFVDTLGKITIPPTYEYVRDFENKTAICKQEEHWGAVDELNKPILDFIYRSIEWEDNYLKVGVKNKRPVFYNALGNSVVDWGYDRFKDFSEGFCAVSQNGKWGLVNEKGKEILPCKYTVINSFSENWAAVQDAMGWYFIDSTLEIKLDLRDTEYLSVGNFSAGLCWYRIKRNNKFYYGFMNKAGERIINSTYTKAFDFQQGRARVVKDRKTGLIDNTGSFVMLPKKYDLVFPFEENGIAQVRVNNMGDFGLINRAGEILTSCIYTKIFPFKNGYAKVVTPEGIGFINTLGHEIIPPQYRAVGELSEGIVAVQHGFSYMWQYINMKNKIAFTGKFSRAEPFKNGRAIVTLRRSNKSANLVIDKKGQEVELKKNGMVLHFAEEKYGFRRFIRNRNGNVQSTYCYYTDSLGKHLFNQKQFTEVEPFKNNIGLVKYDNQKWGTLTKHGYEIIPNKFHKIFPLENNMFSAIAAELFGLYDEVGNMILAPVYDYIAMVPRQNIFRVEQGSKIGYFANDAVWLWQLQD
jgi:hypothetical protein